MRVAKFVDLSLLDDDADAFPILDKGINVLRAAGHTFKCVPDVLRATTTAIVAAFATDIASCGSRGCYAAVGTVIVRAIK